jgi:hypothetical protein
VEVQLDHLAAHGAVAHREAADGQLGVDAALGALAVGHEDDRPRRVPLRHPLERPLRRVQPGRRHPRDVRHHARPLVRAPALPGGLVAQARELGLDVGDRHVGAAPFVRERQGAHR